MTKSDLYDENERLDRLRLIRTENVGPITFRQLIARYGTAREAIGALPSLAGRSGRKRILSVPSRDAALQEYDAVRALGGTMVHMGDACYPTGLAAVEDAPPILSVLGTPESLNTPIVSIVGSRNASTNGKRLASQFAAALGQAGYAVASGLALGIDTAAHLGALDTGTVAVVAGGVDIIYPRENTKLYRDIAHRGAVIAEMPFGTVGQARHFPRRNRIISGMAQAVLVVEATLRSGSLITARFAADQGREVFAIPGSPLDPRARGGNDLIRKGAALIETPDELIQQLSTLPDPAPRMALPYPELKSPPDRLPDLLPDRLPERDGEIDIRTRLLNALGPAPVSVDDLIHDLGVESAVISSVLLEMELSGTVERLSGGRVTRLTSTGSGRASSGTFPDTAHDQTERSAS